MNEQEELDNLDDFEQQEEEDEAQNLFQKTGTYL